MIGCCDDATLVEDLRIVEQGQVKGPYCEDVEDHEDTVEDDELDLSVRVQLAEGRYEGDEEPSQHVEDIVEQSLLRVGTQGCVGGAKA